MNYQEAVDYLNSHEQFGINPGLERIEAICQRLNNPHRAYEVIHVTGTNGKTSTCRMISFLLEELDYRVGLYTSPHLISFTERIVIDNRPVTEKDFAQALSEIVPVMEEIKEEFYSDPLTEFEAITALGFYHFQQAKVDCAAIEVGMGGRWDATNIVSSKVALITSVELDHTDRLGKTKAEIAREKAQIIKARSKAVAGPLSEEAAVEVKKRCAETGAPLVTFGSDFTLLSRSPVEGGQQVIIKGLFDAYQFFLPLLGDHQALNATLAVVSVEQFLGQKIDQAAAARAFRQASSPGRLEIAGKNPTVMLDGAHNPSAAKVLAGVIESDFAFDRLVLVLSILKDKDIEGILSALVPLASMVIVTKNKSDRAESVDKLGKKVARFTENAVIEPDFKLAIDRALGLAKAEDLVLITGSLYTVGEAKELLGNTR